MAANRQDSRTRGKLSAGGIDEFDVNLSDSCNHIVLSAS
jgi:hypothetical protein